MSTAIAPSRPLRVLALMLYDEQAAATRQRLLQYLPFLGRQGVRVDIRTLLDSGQTKRVLTGGKKAKIPILSAYLMRMLHLASAHAYDVLWVHCELFPWLPLEWLSRLSRRPVVVDLDDANYERYVGTMLEGKLHPLWRHAAVCIAGNPTIAAKIGQFCRTITIPTVLDADLWAPAEKEGSPPAVGWIGSPSTWPYVEPLLPAIRGACERHGWTFRAIGGGPASALPWIDDLPWRAETEVSDVQAFGIGIMPLPDTPWARGKCGYKLIQYAACGIPVVASPVGVNAAIADGNGLLATTAEEWGAALTRLIADRSLRARLGAVGRRKIVESYSLASQQERLLGALKMAAG